MMQHEVKAADEWWGTLSNDRRAQVHRWVAQRGHHTEPDPGQMTIDDVLEPTVLRCGTCDEPIKGLRNGRFQHIGGAKTKHTAVPKDGPLQ